MVVHLPALLPSNTLLLPVVNLSNASTPKAMLYDPVAVPDAPHPAAQPRNMLLEPSALLPELQPMNTFELPLVTAQPA